jgi:hypothetical protein
MYPVFEGPPISTPILFDVISDKILANIVIIFNDI